MVASNMQKTVLKTVSSRQMFRFMSIESSISDFDSQFGYFFAVCLKKRIKNCASMPKSRHAMITRKSGALITVNKTLTSTDARFANAKMSTIKMMIAPRI